jgi:hypothetical protein
VLSLANQLGADEFVPSLRRAFSFFSFGLGTGLTSSDLSLNITSSWLFLEASREGLAAFPRLVRPGAL